MTGYSRAGCIEIIRTIETSAGDDLLVSEYDISHIPVSILRTIFDPEPADDYELFFCYSIDESQALALNSFLDPPIDFDFSRYEHAIAAFGDYKPTSESE